MKIFANAACVLALAVLTAGCCSRNEDFAVQKVIADDRVDLKDSSHFALRNLNVASKIDDNGLLTVDVTLEISRSTFWYWLFHGDPLQTLAYRFDWGDAQGGTLAGPWRFSSALPGGILYFHGVAPAEKYTSFKLLVQFHEDGDDLPAAQSGDSAAGTSGAKEASAAAKDDVKKAEVNVKADVKADVKTEAAGKNDVKKGNGKLTESLY